MALLLLPCFIGPGSRTILTPFVRSNGFGHIALGVADVYKTCEEPISSEFQTFIEMVHPNHRVDDFHCFLL